ncbi:6-aminohexanoate hydrolase [Zhengella mangrovi]|uniref:Indoleacetamide hydrolase n=1 Tax=Zhengella mangrovi TaxID=1982044 RepID=A0A2G1QH08_9HYPH|nr:amidase [Zhengella mangrovi]PHP64805.1 6-aminohexanoate hydrolase [Zhengella mangrovi]
MGIDTDYLRLDATGLADMVRRKEVTPGELLEAAIARTEAVNPQINAVAETFYDKARQDLATIPADAPFAGVPMAIKDLAVSLSGVPIHAGSAIGARTASEDATVIRNYRRAGFLPFITATTPEFGLRLVTETRRFGITRNPWNTGHVTGGSSGGSAALVASGAVPVAHASDGGGSIRVPSACTGLVGLKPSRGRVPLTPDASESWHGFTVQHALSRSVRDCAALLDIGSQHDAASPYQAPAPKGSFLAACAANPGSLTLAVYRQSPLGLEISAETMKALDTAVALARDLGHTVEEIDLPMVNRDFIADFARCVASAHAGIIRMEATRLGKPVLGDLERITRIMARFGEVQRAADMEAALQRLQAASRALLGQTARFDAVMMPIIAHPPLACGAMDATGADALTEALLDRLRLTFLLKMRPFLDQMLDKSLWFTHWPAIQNVTGQPSIALPVHVTDGGLPLGIQAAGRIGDEETLLALAAQMETASGWLDRRPPMVRDAL